MLLDPKIKAQWIHFVAQQASILKQELENKSITIGGRTLRFQYFVHGAKPEGGYSLAFGLHGGGGCPPEANDQQYSNHLHLYDNYLPSGMIWFVPRSCQDVWDMWWQPYLLDFFKVIIKGFIFNNLVNPNKVFITGYSAGGDGVYHLGPMVADWLAGAAMMAGHPNGTELENTRNISFSIQVGGQDSPYTRNDLARSYIQKMGILHNKYGGFNPCYNHIYEQCAHWMNLQDANIFPQFFSEIRNPYPDFILFKQHCRTKKPHFYYIEVDPQKHKDLLTVRKAGNVFHIDGEQMKVKLYVNHIMADFSQQIVVFHNNKKTVCRKPKVDFNVVNSTISDRQDPEYIFEDFFVSDPSVELQADQKIVNQDAQLRSAPIRRKQGQGNKKADRGQSDFCCKLI